MQENERFYLSDDLWGKLKEGINGFCEALIGARSRGHCCAVERLRVEAFLWVLLGEAGWRLLPKSFEPWKCFRAWVVSGLWAADALGYPLGYILTGANISDFYQAIPLIRK